MKSIIRFLHNIYRRIDISPIVSGFTVIRVTVFLVWGFSFLFFLSIDSNSYYNYYTNHNYESKFSLELDIYNEIKDEIKIFAGCEVEFADYNCVIYPSPSELIIKDRSPPISFI